MHVQLSESEIRTFFERYLHVPFNQAGVSNGEADERLERRFKAARGRGYMILRDLRATAKWTYRGKALEDRVRRNTVDEVEMITRESFASTSERQRIDKLRDLQGVDWVMASVILHFAFPDCYPVLSQHALTAIGAPREQSFENWTSITKFCREKSTKYGVTMRELDRALWVYAKQKKLRPTHR